MGQRNAKNKPINGRFAFVPRELLRHPAVTTLSHAQFRVLVLLAAEYHGKNNGAIGVTASQAAELGIGSEHTLYAALRELVNRGLAIMTAPASRTPPRPTMFAVTWRSVDDTEYSRSTRVASHDYKNWRPGAA